MIAAWMLWSICAGVLFLVAGLAAERLVERGRRWVWLAAGAGTVFLPVVRSVWRPDGTGAADSAGIAIMMEPVTVTVANNLLVRSADAVLIGTWLVLSCLLLLSATAETLRIRRKRRFWEAGSFLRRDVLWTRRSGPAVVGFVKPQIVLPKWVRGATDDQQELLLAHEQEHIRTHDARLRLLAGLALFAFPWNPVLWVQYRRLGLAIELDCDRRVMARVPGRRFEYGDLLLRVATMRPGLSGMAVAAFAERRSLLERRIRGILKKAPQMRAAQAAALAFGIVFVVSIALIMPGVASRSRPPSIVLAPDEASVAEAPEEGEESADEPVPPADAEVPETPVFTPFTQKPEFVNADELIRAIANEYPPLLREAGIGGTTALLLYVDEYGQVSNVHVAKGSGHTALDEAAVRAMETAEFKPALLREKNVPAWIEIPVTFTTN